MSTDIDWQHELDTSFGAGHDLPPAHYVAVLGNPALLEDGRLKMSPLAGEVLGEGDCTRTGMALPPRAT